MRDQSRIAQEDYVLVWITVQDNEMHMNSENVEIADLLSRGSAL